eukprot:6026291-Alexandrium_andersonii.AAC.1
MQARGLSGARLPSPRQPLPPCKHARGLSGARFPFPPPTAAPCRQEVGRRALIHGVRQAGGE